MTDTQAQEAERLASALDNLDVRRPDRIQNLVSAAALLRSQAARIAELERERDELRAREKACETIREAEMVALVRMGQGLCPMLGLDPLTASPSEIVAAAEALHAQHALVAEFVRDIGRANGIQGKEG